jgi:glycosyltransferase involved in cell wall biosynthesis
MISVITPTYNTPPDVIARTWRSLKNQTYPDWEWIVWDDSPNDLTWRQVYGFCSDERYKIRMFRSHVPSGIIGQVKRWGFMAAEGDILVELDHDDELTPDALQEIHDAFDAPWVGFVYSNWCEINPEGESCRYPEGWAFGYGSDYYDTNHNVWVMRAPELNRTTLSHIVSAPNHVRAWSASLYHELDGHDSTLPVADDYDLVVRTATHPDYSCKRIDKLLYKQHISPNTAQRVRNKEIQDRVAVISQMYQQDIAKRYDD